MRALAALFCLAAALPVAAQNRPACEALLAAIDNGRIHEGNDPAGAAHVATANGTDQECEDWLAKADPPPEPMFEQGPPRGICEQLVAVALARVMHPDWQKEYREIVAEVARGDQETCAEFFEEYGREVLDGRGPYCTRAELIADAGLTQSFIQMLDAATTGDEVLCEVALEAHLEEPAAPPPQQPVDIAQPAGVCETIAHGVRAGAFRYGWQAEADELMELADQGDQDECWEVLEEYASETPDRVQGPWCSRAELAAASGFTRAPDILAEAADSGNETLCRDAVEAHPAAN